MDDLPENVISSWLEDAWLERYLDRELTAEETAWFEAYMLDKPRLVAAIGADTALRDGLHAWHAQERPDTGEMAGADARSATQTVTPDQRPATQARGFPTLSMVAAILIAAALGASAVRWMATRETSAPAIVSPNRIVFDSLRGSASATVVDRRRDSSAPLLIDIAVPTHATAVVAHFSDRSSLALRVAANGFVSLTGPLEALLAKSPIRIAWMLDGESQERQVDIGAAIGDVEG